MAETQHRKFGSTEWRARILDPGIAIKWAVQISGEDGTDAAIAFLHDWNNGTVVTAEEWGEYRYWATGTHEPATTHGDSDSGDAA